MDIELRTKRLVLRPLSINDCEGLTVAINNFEIAKWLSHVPHPYSRDDAYRFIAAKLASPMKPFGIFMDRMLVGMIGLSPELGYWLAQDHWGKGLMTEAATAAIDHWFFTLEKEELCAAYMDGNHASAALLAKLGFVKIGEQVETTPHMGEILHHQMRLTKASWWALRGFPIESDRIYLRPLHTQDWVDLQKIAGPSEVARNMCSVSSPWEETKIKNWISTSKYRGRPGFRLGICLYGGRLIGSIGLSAGPVPSVSYFIDKPFWSRGYASEALEALLRFSASQFGSTEITSDVFYDNPASARVLEKLGFRAFGEDTAQSSARLEQDRIILYRLSQADFESAYL